MPTASQLDPIGGGSPPDPGDVMFCGSFTGSSVPARAYQVFSLAACSSEIASGLKYRFSAYLGSGVVPNGVSIIATAAALFYDSTPPLVPSPSSPLPTGSLGTSTLTQTSTVSSAVGLTQKRITGLVPATTQFVRIALEITTSPTSPTLPRNTGCIDLVSFSVC